MTDDTEIVARRIVGSLGYDADTSRDELSDDEREYIQQRVDQIKQRNAELEEAMTEVAEEHGEPVTKGKMNEHGEFAARTFINHFGSWREAVERCGYEAGKSPAVNR
jgi:hypothetical protein